MKTRCSFCGRKFTRVRNHTLHCTARPSTFQPETVYPKFNQADLDESFERGRKQGLDESFQRGHNARASIIESVAKLNQALATVIGEFSTRL